MTITPSGLPAWTRTASHSQYGGNVNKRNYLSEGVVDAQTDVGADEFCRIAADLEAVIRTAPFATITYLNNDGVPAAPTIESVYMMTGVRTTSYAGDAAPVGFPSAERNGTGDVTFTFASSYDDAYGVSGDLSLEHGLGTAHGSTFADPTVEVVTAQTIRVRVFDAAGSALADKRVTVEVW